MDETGENDATMMMTTTVKAAATVLENFRQTI